MEEAILIRHLGTRTRESQRFLSPERGRGKSESATPTETRLILQQLKLRLKTLLDKKKVMQSRSATTSKISASFITLEEGFQQFGNDLNKLLVGKLLADHHSVCFADGFVAIRGNKCDSVFENPEESPLETVSPYK